MANQFLVKREMRDIRESDAGYILESLGMFSNEINRVTNGINAGDLDFCRTEPNYLIRKIGGSRFITTASRTVYPGRNIYQDHPSFGISGFTGYPRIIFGMLDSEHNFRTAQALEAAVNNGEMGISEIARELDIYPNGRSTVKDASGKLESLGLVDVSDGKIKPRKIAEDILSDDRKRVWEKFKAKDYKIDVWP